MGFSKGSTLQHFAPNYKRNFHISDNWITTCNFGACVGVIWLNMGSKVLNTDKIGTISCKWGEALINVNKNKIKGLVGVGVEAYILLFFLTDNTYILGALGSTQDCAIRGSSPKAALKSSSGNP